MADTRPWEPDRELTTDLAAALIELRFPAIDSRMLERLGSGWEFDVFLTRDDWVVRFPRRQESSQLFAGEAIAHALVEPHLPTGTAIPRVAMTGEPALGFPYRFAAHRFIRGVSSDAMEPTLLPVLARDLAAALAAVHSIPEQQARSACICEMDPEEAGRNEWLELGFEAAFQLRGVHPSVDRALKWLARVSLPVPVFRGPYRLIHHDLDPEHLIVDPVTGRLVGILDWTDAILGDPARDFAFLATWRGWSFTGEVLRSYRVVDGEFISRLRFLSRLLSLMWLATAYRAGSDLTRDIEGVANVFTLQHPT